MPAFPAAPDVAVAATATGSPPVPLAGSDGRYSGAGIPVTPTPAAAGLDIAVACPAGEISWVGLRWNDPKPEGTTYFGDAWERSYGDLQWRGDQPERILPWYFVSAAPGASAGWGVRVRPGAFCSWRADAAGTTLWLDLHSGGSPVRLGARRLGTATVVRVEGDDPWTTLETLVEAMCEDPLPSRDPVLGCNNWYYAYGENFGPDQILRDADTIVELAGDRIGGDSFTGDSFTGDRAPYCVVDAGWSDGGHAPGGPWDSGTAGLFDDMPALARDIAGRGARPGIWFRPAALTSVRDESLLRAGPRPSRELPLDLSRSEVLAQVATDVHRLVGWGFTLLKHDFSTLDHFGQFGPGMTSRLTDAGWSPADNTRTNAEILLEFYRTIRAAAGGAVVLGCNTVGHLAAGLVDVQRIGDDTSGREWERTRRMGINALAFRLPQHRRFFTVDADCVPCTPQTPWERNREFGDLIARTGSALFFSIDPGARTAGTDADIRRIIGTLADTAGVPAIRPADWQATTTPRRWTATDGTDVSYAWDEPVPAG